MLYANMRLSLYAGRLSDQRGASPHFMTGGYCNSTKSHMQIAWGNPWRFLRFQTKRGVIMATVHIALGRARTHGANAMAKAPTSSAVVTSSGTSGLSGLTAVEGDYAYITSFNGNCYVVAGSGTPVASASNGYGVAPGGTLSFWPLSAGDKIAVIDATVA